MTTEGVKQRFAVYFDGTQAKALKVDKGLSIRGIGDVVSANKVGQGASWYCVDARTPKQAVATALAGGFRPTAQGDIAARERASIQEAVGRRYWK
jgi:hypothetical protein